MHPDLPSMFSQSTDLKASVDDYIIDIILQQFKRVKNLANTSQLLSSIFSEYKFIFSEGHLSSHVRHPSKRLILCANLINVAKDLSLFL